jgi:hypothetical protein
MDTSRTRSGGRNQARWVVAVVAILTVPAAGVALEPRSDFPRRPDGRPDLSGTYDIATLTPVERPTEYGDKLTLSDEEAAAIGEQEMLRMAARNQPSDPDREAPPEGGDGSEGAAGNVGGYNTFWIDRGEGAFKIDGQWRTSIIVDPRDGRFPPLSEQGRLRAERAAPFLRANDGIAFWIDMEVGPYDDPELRPLQERCILSRSRSGPPAMPALYNNLKRIVQTDDHVTIVAEQIHDARIIRLDAEHGPPAMRKWMGDSVGHWEGDTLVVDTLGFKTAPTGLDISEDLHVVERFTRIDAETLLYQFTVNDPRYVAPWSGELVWPATDEKLFEYACHEGNYSFGNIMRGARVLEEDARAEREKNGRESGGR